MFNPLTIKLANDVKNYLKKHPLEATKKYVGKQKLPDGSVVVTYQFQFPNDAQAETFMKLGKLAEESEKFLSE